MTALVGVYRGRQTNTGDKCTDHAVGIGRTLALTHGGSLKTGTGVGKHRDSVSAVLVRLQGDEEASLDA